jgi:uncharacterized small protein (TIGR04563 family)
MATKQSLYFPEETLREIMRESIRLDRSLSWTVQQAWRVARTELCKVPAVAPPAAAGEHSTRRSLSPKERGASAQVLEFLKGKFERAPH